MNILVDSSVWIDYFRNGVKSKSLDIYIKQNVICINDLILAELVPFLKVKKEQRVITLLNEITKIPLEINWKKIIEYQTVCIQKGINRIGIPDLIIVDNVIQNNLILYSFDKHFELINLHLQFEMV
ncbi:MAG: twitching motility protein PilT [Ignavibacteria bacterium GWB2_35_6b]|nr:MAG: twitching motility protein PilT [Ignavibacteria bacterium GWB2_35_6b]